MDEYIEELLWKCLMSLSTMLFRTLWMSAFPKWLLKLNLCLWRCIAVHRGARPDRSTQAARELAKSFYKLDTVPNAYPKTLLDELDQVERHLNQRSPFSDWLGIWVYEPEREVDGEVIWPLRQNPSDKLNILTIGVYDGHAFVIKDIAKLARTYACVHCRARFTQAGNLQRHTKTCSQGETVIDCPNDFYEALISYKKVW